MVVWRLMVVCAGIAILMAVAAPNASAVPRNAVAQGGATSGDCTGTPCTFTAALAAAQPDDEVVVHPGDHAVPSVPASPLVISKRLNIHGVEGQARPRLIHSSGGVGAFIRLTSGANGGRLRHLQVESGTGGGGTSNYALAVAGNVTVERLVATVGGPSAGAALQLELASPVVRDTVAHSPTGNAVEARATTDAQLRNVTAYAPGALRTGIVVTAYDYGNNLPPCDPSIAGSLTARNVIARGGARDVRASSTCNRAATLNLRNSNFRRTTGDTVGGALATIDDGGTSGGNQTGDPLFANAAGGDFHVRSGSPVIDAGGADPLNGTSDIDGNPRPLGAGIDIGADEFVPPAPAPPAVPTQTGGGAPGPASDTTRPRARIRRVRCGKRRRGRRGCPIRVSATDVGGTVRRVTMRIWFNKRVCRRRAGRRRCERRAVSRKLKVRRSRLFFVARPRLKRGRYRVAAVAVDSSGNRSRRARKRFRVR